jgi:hypothetical protein
MLFFLSVVALLLVYHVTVFSRQQTTFQRYSRAEFGTISGKGGGLHG